MKSTPNTSNKQSLVQIWTCFALKPTRTPRPALRKEAANGAELLTAKAAKGGGTAKKGAAKKGTAKKKAAAKRGAAKKATKKKAAS